jgi:hypothetical protein
VLIEAPVEAVPWVATGLMSSTTSTPTECPVAAGKASHEGPPTGRCPAVARTICDAHWHDIRRGESERVAASV